MKLQLRRRWASIATLALIALVTGCAGRESSESRIAGGDVQRGRVAIERYGCGSCHVVPGVRGASGGVGPPLDGIGDRAYLAGVLPNTPENMLAWIRDPQKIVPRSAMPDLGVSESEARDIVAYLYTLQ